MSAMQPLLPKKVSVCTLTGIKQSFEWQRLSFPTVS
jgi:hypothetical protein